MKSKLLDLALKRAEYDLRLSNLSEYFQQGCLDGMLSSRDPEYIKRIDELDELANEYSEKFTFDVNRVYQIALDEATCSDDNLELTFHEKIFIQTFNSELHKLMFPPKALYGNSIFTNADFPPLPKIDYSIDEYAPENRKFCYFY